MLAVLWVGPGVTKGRFSVLARPVSGPAGLYDGGLRGSRTISLSGAVAASGRFSADEKKDLEIQGLSLRWCPEGDSNSHSFRKRILNPPRLPIPPSGLNGGEV